MSLKVLELFAGIGACSKALERLGVEHEIVDAVEIDKYAIKSFNAVHGTNFEPQDITKWDKDIQVDLIMHGSPCQDFSVAGKQAGGDEGSGTRSSLMYETLRIVKKLQPKYVVWENVKNLLSKKHRHNFDAYIDAMSELGYVSKFQVLNAKNYGVPQNRERVFTVSIRSDVFIEKNGGADWFEFPEPFVLDRTLKDLLDENVDEKYYLSDKALACFMSDGTGKYPRRERFLQNINRKNQDIGNSVTTRAGGRPTDNFVKEPFCVASRGRGENNEQHLEPRMDGVTNTITSVQKDNYVAIRTADNLKTQLCNDLVANGVVKGGEVVIHSYTSSRRKDGLENAIESTDGIMPTLTTRPDILGYAENQFDGCRIRKLTPKECWRLMGFDDSDFEKAAKVNSNTQLYKQAGNSIVVNVLEAILRTLLIKKTKGNSEVKNEI